MSGFDFGVEFKEVVKEVGCIGVKIVCVDRDVMMILCWLRESVITMDVMVIVMGRTWLGGFLLLSVMGGFMDNIEYIVENFKMWRYICEMCEYLVY